jgi:hypothetical protein
MKNKITPVKVIRWVARIWGTLNLLFILLFVIAHLAGSVTGKGEKLGNPSADFILFPLSIIIGLAIALKWELTGGIVTILGIILFHISRPDIGFDLLIDSLAAPGVLYLLYWLLDRNIKNQTAQH